MPTKKKHINAELARREKQQRQNAALSAIKRERVYQELKYPGHQHTVGEWILILRKVLNDAEYMWGVRHNPDAALHELRQLAAVALAGMEQCGVYPRSDLDMREAREDAKAAELDTRC